MKTAREMFEELGYMQELDDECLFYSRITVFSYNTYEERIAFEDREIIFTNKDELSMPELKAINQQCKELGWLE